MADTPANAAPNTEDDATTEQRIPIAPAVPVGLDGHPMRPPQPTFKGRPFDDADPEPGFLFHNPA